MNWIIDNIWQVLGVVTAIFTQFIMLIVGWVKLNGKVENNTRAIVDLKTEVERDQTIMTKQMKDLSKTQNDILQSLASINAKMEILIDKK